MQPPSDIRRGARGFTLIELMIALAIVAIVAAVAYPSYSDHVRRSKIAQATSELGTMRVRLEQFYQDNRHYGSSASACGVAVPSAPAFTFTCNWGPGGSNQSFLITATGVTEGGMDDYQFTVDQDNAQRTVRFAGAGGLPASCWMKNRGDAC